MKKQFAIILFLFLFASSTFAGPFGLKMGMSLSEVAEACGGETPEYIADDRYLIHPVKTHPLFESYVAWIGEKNGLYYIKGISRDIQTTGYGTEIKQEFDRILSPLEKKYGRFQQVNKISADALWREDRYFMRSIADGSRTYEAYWVSYDETDTAFDGLVSISIGIKTSTIYEFSKGYIWIEYGFSNQDSGFGSFDDVL